MRCGRRAREAHAYDVSKETRKKEEPNLGIRRLVLDEYKKNGKQKALELFHILNKKNYGGNYTEKMFENWIRDLENSNGR